MNYLAYVRRRSLSLLSLSVAAALVIQAMGCSAGVKPSAGGSGGSTAFGGSPGKGGGGTSTGGASGGNTGAGGAAAVTGSGGGTSPDAAACQQKDIMFVPKTPTVFLLVDRGGSVFDTMVQGSNGTTIPLFTALKNAVETLLPPLDSQVRFGLGAFTGDASDQPQMCPAFDQVAIAPNNASAIMTEYDKLSTMGKPQFKPETPMIEVLNTVKSTLLGDSGNGQKYVLYIGNGLTDFCDDQSDISHCAADAVTYELQDMYTSGIQTLVVALPSTYGPLYFAQVLQTFANAGTGQPVAIPNASGGPAPANTAADIYNECYYLSSSGPVQYAWRQYYSQAGRTGTTAIASYASQGGNAPVYTPTSTNQLDLLNAISRALGNVKSCTFDLSSFKIDVTKLSEASVLINGTTVPLDANNTNGWDMHSDGTTLELYGPACETWRAPASNDIKFNFPCDIIINVG